MTTDYTMPASTDITFAHGVDTGTLVINIVPVTGVIGNKRFTVGFTTATVGQPGTPNTVEIIIQEAGKPYAEVVTLKLTKTFFLSLFLVNMLTV